MMKQPQRVYLTHPKMPALIHGILKMPRPLSLGGRLIGSFIFYAMSIILLLAFQSEAVAKNCTNSQLCGNSCISWSKVCHIGDSTPTPTPTPTPIPTPTPTSNTPPVASFSIDVTSGLAPLTVKLDASASSDPAGSIQSYQWTCSDGQTATGKVTSLTFGNTGTYTITLTVADDKGGTATAPPQTVMVVAKGSQTTSGNNTQPVSDLEPAADEVPMDYSRDDTTGDVWGLQPAWQLPSPPGKLSANMWQYGLRSIYLAKYACQDAGIRDWMPTNIANGVYYCTNSQDKQKIANYLRTLAAKLTAEDQASSTRAKNLQPVSPIEPGTGEVPMDYYRDPTTGDVWGQQPAWQLPAKGTLPQDLWKYGLRSLYLAKYACQDAEVRNWMPTNIANGIYYCTNPQDRAKTISYLLSLADKLEKE